MNPVIQWNCRGLRANYDELQLLTNHKKPAAIMLQETFLKGNTTMSFSGYNILRRDFNSDRPSGGVAMLINNAFLYSEINLNTNLQAIAARISLHKTITFCSLYLPPSSPITKNQLINLANQLPPPFIIMGDFNGHSPLWGSPDTNDRGRLVESFLEELDLCVLNDGTNTYLHPATNTRTAIDLTVCDPSIFLDFSWRVHDDECGSDHFPVIISPIEEIENTSTGRWNFNKANWPAFNSLCHANMTEELILKTEDPTQTFTNTLIDIAKQTNRV